MGKNILNLGAGKVEFSNKIRNNENVYMHVDMSYTTSDISINPISDAEEAFVNAHHNVRDCDIFCSADVFEFLDTFKYKFDVVRADRIFEHMFYDSGQIGRLLDACNQITTDNGELEILVPNHLELAKILVDVEDEFGDLKPSDASSHALLMCSEWQNTEKDAHGSCWTPELAKYYIESEGGTWIVDNIDTKVPHKGRDIYMRITCKKPQTTKDSE